MWFWFKALFHSRRGLIKQEELRSLLPVLFQEKNAAIFDSSVPFLRRLTLVSSPGTYPTILSSSCNWITLKTWTNSSHCESVLLLLQKFINHRFISDHTWLHSSGTVVSHDELPPQISVFAEKITLFTTSCWNLMLCQTFHLFGREF